MALIPLKQFVTVYGKETSDGWGGSVSGDSRVIKARVTNKFVTITKAISTLRDGDEITTSLSVIIGANDNINYDEIVEYVDEFGVITRKNPKEIRYIRGVSGKVVLCEVLI